MPIAFACPECGNRLQVREELARERVACPDCRAILTAPASESSTPREAVPVAEIVAAAPSTSRRQNRPPEPHREASGHAEPNAPHPNGSFWSFNEQEGSAGSQTGAGALSNGELVRRIDQVSATSVRWAAFGTGCWLVMVATWVELAGVVLFVLAIEITLLGVLTKTTELMVVNWAGPFFALPFWVLLFLGSIMTAVGRFRMLAVPPDTGASGVLNGALVLTWLRVTAIIGALVFALLAGFEWRNQQSGPMFRYFLYAVAAHGLAVIAGRVAELSIIPAMAVIGGEIPSRSLRRRAGLLALVFQVVAMAWVALAIFVYYLLVARTTFDGLIRRPEAGPARTNEPPPDPEMAVYAAATVVFFVLVIEIAYAGLYASLYSSAHRAASGDAKSSSAPRS